MTKNKLRCLTPQLKRCLTPLIVLVFCAEAAAWKGDAACLRPRAVGEKQTEEVITVQLNDTDEQRGLLYFLKLEKELIYHEETPPGIRVSLSSEYLRFIGFLAACIKAHTVNSESLITPDLTEDDLFARLQQLGVLTINEAKARRLIKEIAGKTPDQEAIVRQVGNLALQHLKDFQHGHEEMIENREEALNTLDKQKLRFLLIDMNKLKTGTIEQRKLMLSSIMYSHKIKMRQVDNNLRRAFKDRSEESIARILKEFESYIYI